MSRSIFTGSIQRGSSIFGLLTKLLTKRNWPERDGDSSSQSLFYPVLTGITANHFSASAFVASPL
jgi:hypothetical protein